jgi:hypothetical protein
VKNIDRRVTADIEGGLFLGAVAIVVGSALPWVVSDPCLRGCPEVLRGADVAMGVSRH